MSKITVIVPVYKVEPYLRRCVDSILEQTFSDFDLVLIDDDSPDDCGRICDEYAKQDKRVFVLHHKENLGLSAARNSGIDWAFERSNSEWITFIDSDDWVANGYLEALYNAAEKYGIAAVGRYNSHGEEPPTTEPVSVSYISTVDFWQSKKGVGVVTWGKLYKKELFSSLRYPVGKIHEDEYVTYRIIFSFEKIPLIDPPLYMHLIRPDSIMQLPWRPARLDVLDALEEQLAFFMAREEFAEIGKNAFFRLVNANQDGQKKIQEYPFISNTERRLYLIRLQRQMKRILLRYHRYNWVSPWNKGKDLWLYSDTFTSVHVVHMAWRKIKSIFNLS